MSRAVKKSFLRLFPLTCGLKGPRGLWRALGLSAVLALFTLGACTSTPDADGNDKEDRSGDGDGDCAATNSCNEPCVGVCLPELGTGGAEPGPDGSGGSTLISGQQDVTFSPPSGTFQGSVAVTLTSNRDSAEIRYTTDGTAVTAASAVYSGAPLSFTEATELRAQVFVAGAPVGEEVMAWYIARDFDLSVDLPVMVLDSYGAPAPDREYVNAAFMIFETKGTNLADSPTVASRAGYHLRGQSSASFEKPPYRVELRDGNDDDLDHPLVGMPADSDWVLRGPFADKALIRDAFFYGLGADMGMAAPRFAHVELYRNVGEGPLSQDDYLGVYLLVETIKNTKNRLDLSQLEETDTAPEDLSGGYIFKFEWMAAEEPTLPCEGTNCWNDLEVYDPLPLAPAQADWLGGHLREFVDVLYSSNFADAATGYQAYIDADSFVDQIIVNELGREMDSYIRSAYFHKDRDGKIVAGPLWDYNLSLDCGGFFDNRLPEGFQYEQERDPVANDWMGRLLEDPAFQARLNSRWQELRTTLLSDSALAARVDALTAPLPEAAQRNFVRWPNLTTEMIGFFYTPTDATWQGQVQAVRNFLVARTAWLDTVWN